MLIPDPLLALKEFRRVMKQGGYAVVSVETTADRSLTTRINTAIGRHIPSRAAAAAIYYSLGKPDPLRSLMDAAGFRQVEVLTETTRFPFSSFDAYFSAIEEGAGSVGAEFCALPAHLRSTVRDEIWRELGSAPSGHTIEIGVAIQFASGCK